MLIIIKPYYSLLKNLIFKRPRLSVLASLFMCLLAGSILFLNEKYNALAADNPPQADLSLTPANLVLPPDGSVKLVMNAATNIAFIRIDIPFNPQKIHQTAEITVTATCFKALTSDDIADITTAATANQKGRIVQIYTLKTDCVNSAPTGAYEIAVIPFGINPAYTVTNQSISLDIDPATVQVVDSIIIGNDVNGNPIYRYRSNTAQPNTPDYLSLTTHLALINLNPVTPTITQKPSATLTPTSVLTPVLTPTSIPTPTLTVTPTLSPASTLTPTITPTPYPTQIPTPSLSPTPVPTAKYTITPSSGMLAIGNSLTFNIMLDTGSQAVSGFTARLIYSYSKSSPEVSVARVDLNSSFGNSSGWTCPVKDVNYQTNMVLIDISCVNNSSQGYLSGGPTSIAAVTLKANDLPNLNPVIVRFDPTLSQVTRKVDGWNILMVPASTGIYNVISINPTMIPTATPIPVSTLTPGISPTPTISIIPSSSQTPTRSEVKAESADIDLSYHKNWFFNRGQIAVRPYLHTNSQVTTVRAVINFDPKMLQVVKISENKLQTNNIVSSSFDNSKGTIIISQSNSEGFKKNGLLANIIFKAVDSGTTKLSLVTADNGSQSSVISRQSSDNILRAPKDLTLYIRVSQQGSNRISTSSQHGNGFLSIIFNYLQF